MTDHRFLRTDQDIERNFVALLGSMNFNDITIAKLVDKTMISRPTFYEHFNSLYDLAERTVEEYLCPFKEIFAQALDSKSKHMNIKEIYPQFANKVADTLIDCRREYLAVRKIPLGTNSFDQRLKKILLTNLAPYFSDSQSKLKIIYLTSVLLGNLDFVLEEQRVPKVNEVLAGIESVIGIIAGNGEI
ncbi:TetR/AcrR family transcriptional regulator [Ligilactobacillus acidipiscis]|uniref:TetR/AcrR family transcriptional regulator n=1 Tax=Ligilactobacillus acidipiscis TaxID=89059 RepID=UPI0023F84C52|nr:TetR/AcrR family transcriptional regulator [Ligilactobacillus acidipiscis]WEV57435.1 TetR/AcrR family transcriptional regulator [Ligilactobacillus acidipiscis]